MKFKFTSNALNMKSNPLSDLIKTFPFWPRQSNKDWAYLPVQYNLKPDKICETNKMSSILTLDFRLKEK